MRQDGEYLYTSGILIITSVLPRTRVWVTLGYHDFRGVILTRE